MMGPILIVGGGAVGLISALRLASSGVSCTVLEQKPWGYWQTSGRQFAIAHDVMHWLDANNIIGTEKFWSITQAALTMEHEPNTIEFYSHDAKLAYLGGMIAEHTLMQWLFSQVQRSPYIEFVCSSQLHQVSTTSSGVRICDDQGKEYFGVLCIAADGQNSWVRRQMDISCFRYPFFQYASNAIVGFEGNPRIVWDVFSENQCVGVLPISLDRAACIVMEPTGSIAFSTVLQKVNTHLKNTLALTLIDSRHVTYPLTAGWALSPVKENVIFLGEAALWVHPMMGQGLNIALRYAASVLDALPDILAVGYDVKAWLQHLPARDGATALGINSAASVLQRRTRFFAWRALSFCASFPKFAQWCVGSGCAHL